MKKIAILPALAALMLSGCSVGKYEYSSEAMKRVDMNFTGIPTILGIGALGTSIPLTPEYSLTAAHVAKLSVQRVKAYHPYCDLAIIYHKNDIKTLPKFRNGDIGEPVKMYGYSFITAMPVESSGVNLALTGIRNEWNKRPCVAMVSNAGVVKGMSGGAVYNKDDTIGGVIVGFTNEIKRHKNTAVPLKDVSLYIPYNDFKEWLSKSTT
ncbi:lipoprotein [Erwinia sp. MMLR14_017]|uniref:lipoprotein n=1 Tax=Erwinia sp. MMLR14_017 TaxID=3093842 RepID=UPI00298F69D4|nr:lipoprotein [Erwinia sp. MMLR14_017]MDW8846291.1 lipoprotein [Erwinia sp. MMLR14_017]